ncbi:MAG: peptidase domain-containing ABC transporter [Gammaproteobacteria bacterium]|nr:peptidase domain-containing ABC transporter [Gammaproteobacteria bacterium]
MKNPVELLEFSGSRKLKLILQTEAAECGLACIAMVANYYEYKIDLNTLRREYPISLKGASLQSLINTADRLQLASRPLRLDMEDLPKLSLPCILHWDMNHFVVLKKVTKHNITILDPGQGERIYRLPEVSRHFSGVALELTPTKNFKKKKAEKKLKLSELWDRITGLKRSLIQVFILSLLLQAFAIAAPFYMQLTVDDVIVSHDLDLMLILAIGFLLLMLIQVAVTALRSFVIMLMGTQMNIQIANNLFRHLIRLPLDWFEKRHIGDVVSRFGSLDQVKELLTTGVIEAIVDGIMVIGTLAMMFIYSPTLAWVVIVAVILYSIIRVILYKPLRRLSEENIVANAKENSNFMETVRATQTIKIFGKETQRQTVWQNLYADTMNSGIRLGKLNIGYSAINGLLFGIENVVVIYLAATNVIDGIISVGMLYAFMAYKQQFTGKAASLIDKFIQFKMLSLHLTRIGDIALTPTESDASEMVADVLTKQEIKGEISLNRLSFRYSATEPFIFENVSLTIKSGQSIAIIGPSGCGKTTLMKVMLGLLKAETGHILVDGLDIIKMGNQNYRNQIAAVMQDDQLLSGSIADNISFFDPEFEQEKIEACAKMAAIHPNIMSMPMAYNSLIGDMGTTLSGGQKQRIILARALYKRPKILFLDEATSHLDTELESHVNNSIKHLKMTRIIIAHRQETIKSADRVLLMKSGKLSEVTK